eukprot:553808_1
MPRFLRTSPIQNDNIPRRYKRRYGAERTERSQHIRIRAYSNHNIFTDAHGTHHFIVQIHRTILSLSAIVYSTGILNFGASTNHQPPHPHCMRIQFITENQWTLDTPQSLSSPCTSKV